MVTRIKRSRRNPRRFFDEAGEAAFWRAFHSHIEDRAYERLKDPAYLAWLSDWLEGFLSALVRDLRTERRARGRKRRGPRPPA